MAITQISKILVRTGSNDDLPQLDVGEIGFATDTQRVYIGNDPDIIPNPISGPNVTELITTSTNNLLHITTSADLANSSSMVNNANKAQGLLVFNTTTNLIYVSGGSTSTSAWYPSNGGSPITPT